MDIMHLMMQSINPKDFAPEHRDMVVQDLEKLIGRFALRGIERSAGAEEQAIETSGKVLITGKVLPQGTNHPQAPRIKPVPEMGTVGSLLESIRYASLVRSERG